MNSMPEPQHWVSNGINLHYTNTVFNTILYVLIENESTADVLKMTKLVETLKLKNRKKKHLLHSD